MAVRLRQVAFVVVLCCVPVYAADPLQVRTDKGVVEGVATTDGKVIAFKGIPFAAPPIEDLRWKAPQPVAKWKHVLPAHEFGHHCIQSATYPDMVFHDSGPSEDCLTLNVWAPMPPKGKAKGPGLPVMVWIFGGGFVTGGTSENRQDGQFLAHRGVIVVSMNYRLGVLGFLAHPELATESGHGASGNYGLMDQSAALGWVRQNIAAFGGDPGNVTLFGESAGSFSVSAQMASPLAKGLIAKAIGESGGAFSSAGLSFPAREDAEASTVKWAEKAFGTSKIFYLRSLSVDDLLKAAKAPGAPRFGPDVDGYFLPDSVPNLYASGQQAHVPLLAGWNSDEQHTPGRTKPTAESFKAQAAADFGADAPGLLAVYPAESDVQAVASANDLAGDRFIAFSTWKWIEAQVQTGSAPVYRYFFDLGSPGDKNHAVSAGAFHSDDIEYVFGALDSRPGMVQRPEDRRLSEQMGQYWTNFARTGDPNGPGLPKWPVYTDAAPMVMHLDADSAARMDGFRPRYLFLDSVWNRPKE